jgi:hypothetical protein
MAVRLRDFFAQCGNDVLLGSRTPDRAARIADGLVITALTSC